MEPDHPRAACFSVDVEQDCPPYLSGHRGIVEGLPPLMEAIEAAGVAATFFVTGDVARRFPDAVARIVGAGYELGCHGDTHRDFTTLSAGEAEREIAAASQALRRFGPVSSFRAPYLRMPREYLPLLVKHGYHLDSSQARYKFGRHHRPGGDAPLVRIPASVTSSVLRIPGWIRNPWLAALKEPIVLFVHPWEFVDLTGENLRIDCRFRTGAPALAAVSETLGVLRKAGCLFFRIGDFGRSAAQRGG
jgi:peptidoglycan-N-acetylglucosamine deacetylase